MNYLNSNTCNDIHLKIYIKILLKNTSINNIGKAEIEDGAF